MWNEVKAFGDTFSSEGCSTQSMNIDKARKPGRMGFWFAYKQSMDSLRKWQLLMASFNFTGQGHLAELLKMLHFGYSKGMDIYLPRWTVLFTWETDIR